VQQELGNAFSYYIHTYVEFLLRFLIEFSAFVLLRCTILTFSYFAEKTCGLSRDCIIGFILIFLSLLGTQLHVLVMYCILIVMCETQYIRSVDLLYI